MKLQSWSVLLFKVEFQRIRQYITDSRHYFLTSNSYSSSDLLLSSTKECWSVWTSHLTTGNFLKWEDRTTGVRPPSTLFVTRASVAVILPTRKTGLKAPWNESLTLLSCVGVMELVTDLFHHVPGFYTGPEDLNSGTSCLHDTQVSTEHLPSPSFHSLRGCRSASRVPSSQAWSWAQSQAPHGVGDTSLGS